MLNQKDVDYVASIIKSQSKSAFMTDVKATEQAIKELKESNDFQSICEDDDELL